MKVYATPAEALEDAMRLAGAMTLKMAGIDVPFGGGKAVLAIPGPLADGDRRELLLSYGELVDSLGGAYRTGPDVNTTVADMDVIGERTRTSSAAASGEEAPAIPARTPPAACFTGSGRAYGTSSDRTSSPGVRSSSRESAASESDSPSSSQAPALGFS